MKYKKKGDIYYYSYQNQHTKEFSKPREVDEKSFTGVMKSMINNNPKDEVSIVGQGDTYKDYDKFKNSPLPAIQSKHADHFWEYSKPSSLSVREEGLKAAPKSMLIAEEKERERMRINEDKRIAQQDAIDKRNNAYVPKSTTNSKTQPKVIANNKAATTPSNKTATTKTATNNNSNMNPDYDGIIYDINGKPVEKFVRQLDGNYKIIPFKPDGQLDINNAINVSDADFKSYIGRTINEGGTTDNGKLNYSVISSQPNYNDTPSYTGSNNIPNIADKDEQAFRDMMNQGEPAVKIYDKEGNITGQYVIQDDNTYIYHDINDPNFGAPSQNDPGKKLTNAELQDLIKSNAAKGGKTDVEFEKEKENDPFYEKDPNAAPIHNPLDGPRTVTPEKRPSLLGPKPKDQNNTTTLPENRYEDDKLIVTKPITGFNGKPTVIADYSQNDELSENRYEDGKPIATVPIKGFSGKPVVTPDYSEKAEADKAAAEELAEEDIEEFEDADGNIVKNPEYKGNQNTTTTNATTQQTGIGLAPYHGDIKTLVPHDTRANNQWIDRGQTMTNTYNNPNGTGKVVNYTRYIDYPSDDVTYSFNDLGNDARRIAGNVFNAGSRFDNRFQTKREKEYESPRNRRERKEKEPSSRELENNYIKQLAAEKLSNPNISQLDKLESPKMARKYETEVWKQQRELNRNQQNPSVPNNRIARINQRVDDKLVQRETIQPPTPEEIKLAEDNLIQNMKTGLPKQQFGGLIKAQNGEYIPFDVANPNTYNFTNKKKEPTTTGIVSWDKEPLASKYFPVDKIYDSIPESNMSIYDPNYKPASKPTPNNANDKEFVFDPKKLHVYGDKLQHRANMLPVKYNVFKSLFDKAEVQNPIYSTQDVASTQGIRRNQIAPNMNPLIDARAANNQGIRDTGRGSGQIINALQASHNNTQKGMNDEMYRVKNANQAQQNMYLQQLDKVGNTRREIDTLVDEKNRQHRLAQDKFQRDAVESGEKMMINKGLLHNQELEDHIKLSGYLNQIATDYKFVQGPNGVPYVQYIGKGNGKQVSMPLGTFKAFLSGNTGVEYPETEEEKKKRVPSGASSYTTDGGKATKVEKNGGYVPRKRKTF